MRILARLAALAFVLVSAPAAIAADSAYTDVDLDHCETLSKPGAEDEPGVFVSLKCKGYKNYPFYFKEGDLRQAVYFGHLDSRIVDSAFETFGPFNHIGKKVEWRLDKAGEPYAAIIRYFMENIDPATGMPDKSTQGQVLVVSKVGQIGDETGCVAGYVDALKNPNPNALAREVADTVAAGFACGEDRPTFHGSKSPSGNDPAYNFPEPADQ